MSADKNLAKPGKDVVYIDLDDEITSIIDKVENAKEKMVALVLPKRATVMQSIVNMRLLKRAADSAGRSARFNNQRFGPVTVSRCRRTAHS